MVHLIWGAHDLLAVITRRNPEAGTQPRESQDVQATRDQ
jgi:hypothetical protein